MLKKRYGGLTWLVRCLLTLLAAQQGFAEPIDIQQVGSKYKVSIGGEPFAEVDYSTYAKPIVYPIYGPNQVPMTRNYPMVLGAKYEAKDHPHHKSMWFGHGDVNGISFWHEQGKIINEAASATNDSVTLKNKLVGPNRDLIAHETATIRFSADESVRMIDWDVTLHADVTHLKLGDTKEGTMAVRTHPNLRLDGASANGTATNSNGATGKSIWGKPAKWVDYSGTIDDQEVGIAIFDHPQNLRHPTTWHARTYGLVAANPFGLSYFVGKDQDGTQVIPKGDSLRLRYRFVFHQGDAKQAKIADRYAEYTGE